MLVFLFWVLYFSGYCVVNVITRISQVHVQYRVDFTAHVTNVRFSFCVFVYVQYRVNFTVYLTNVDFSLLISAGSYVALTLLGRPPGQNQKPLEPPPQPHYSKPSSPTERVTAPQPVDVSF